MKWLYKNFGHRLRFALKNPVYTLGSLRNELAYEDERFLSSITEVPARTIRKFLQEPIQTDFFASRLKEAEAAFHALTIESADFYAKKVLLQYAAVRAFRPETVVETGVANGVSSAYLLLAPEANGCGTLHSIGLDDPQYLPGGKSLGWVVPEQLRHRWKLLIGDSREQLPMLLNDLRSIDVFVHDSLHTYDHMLFEYRTAYPYLRPDGLLLSDDALWNQAFPEFTREAGVSQARILRGVGFLKKNAP